MQKKYAGHMPTPLTLPRFEWGSPDATKRALLVHGLGSTGALMWRLGVALADAGWHATAVDLRGHGGAPRALDYTIEAFAADLAHTRSRKKGTWDAVIGHSLGGAASIVTSVADPAWTKRLVLLDPAIALRGKDAKTIRRSQKRAFADNRIWRIRRENPSWHPQDHELKVDAVARSSAWAIDQVSVQNPHWDVRDHAHRLSVPTAIIASDPKINSLFRGRLADEVLAANPLITSSVVPGASHSLHRDRPLQTIEHVFEALN